MLHRKDVWIIVCILAVSLILFGVSRMAPKQNVEERHADVTMAPDAVEYIDPTEAPEPEPVVEPEATAEPEVPVESEATAEPKVTVEPEATVEPEVPVESEATAEPEVTVEQEAAVEPENETKAAVFGPVLAPQTDKVQGHVVITVHGRQYGDPIPMDRDKIITVRQETGEINRIHITPESVYMESSTCENQDCVGEGEVTLDNYRTRILSTYIICLPNGVQVEMIPAE